MITYGVKILLGSGSGSFHLAFMIFMLFVGAGGRGSIWGGILTAFGNNCENILIF
jgi:hypothetical protein